MIIIRNKRPPLDSKLLEKQDITVIDQAPMSDYTTFRLGGNCRTLLSCQTSDQIQKAIAHCVQNNYEFILIGGGSNLVVADFGMFSSMCSLISLARY